jgi:hypothetical protein
LRAIVDFLQHENIYDIELNENLPQTVIDLPLPVEAAGHSKRGEFPVTSPSKTA